MAKLVNVTIKDYGAGYWIMADGLVVTTQNSLGNAWRHIQWMYEVASQEFTVGPKKIPVKDWLAGMMYAGFMDKKNYSWMKDTKSEDLPVDQIK